MTRTLAVDSTNDIFIGPDGALAVATARDAVLHCCAQAAKTQLGEMLYAVDQGIPNFQALWSGTPNTSLFESYLRRALLSVPDVLGVESVTIDATGGVLTYVATIVTAYGSGTLNGL